MKNDLEIQIGKQSAIWSFSVGTFLFLAYCITNSSIFLPIGLCFLLLAIVYNIIILLIVMVAAFLKRDMFLEHLKTIGLMLLNIPVAFLYLNLLGF